MKINKYSAIFLGCLVWLIVGSFIESIWIDLFFAGVSLIFLILIINDLYREKLAFKVPSILNLIIDIFALGTIFSGTIFTIDYGNIFVYLFTACTTVIIFTERKESELESL